MNPSETISKVWVKLLVRFFMHEWIRVRNSVECLCRVILRQGRRIVINEKTLLIRNQQNNIKYRRPFRSITRQSYVCTWWNPISSANAKLVNFIQTKWDYPFPLLTLFIGFFIAWVNCSEELGRASIYTIHGGIQYLTYFRIPIIRECQTSGLVG